MKRTRVMLLGLLAATLIAASAAPAGATVFNTVGIYYNGWYGGDNQCAWSGNFFSDQEAAADLVAQANSATTHSTNCGTQFGLPAGWITAQVAVQRWTWNAGTGSWNWATAYSSGTTTNLNGGYTAFAYVNVNNPPAALYRNVTGHNAVIAGAWRPYLYASNSILFT